MWSACFFFFFSKFELFILYQDITISNVCGLLVLDLYLPPVALSTFSPLLMFQPQLSALRHHQQRDALWWKLLVMVLNTFQAYHTALEEKVHWWTPPLSVCLFMLTHGICFTEDSILSELVLENKSCFLFFFPPPHLVLPRPWKYFLIFIKGSWNVNSCA